MKIKPMKSYDAPIYPTLPEAREDARLLEPSVNTLRGRVSDSLAPLIGAGIFLQLTTTSCSNKPDMTDVQIEIVEFKNGAPDSATRTVANAIPATRVAPLLEEALANDGRGGFGCVAVSAPVFLSENEALDLIETELAKVGLKVKDFVTVEGLQIPVPAESEKPYDNYSEKDFEKRLKESEKMEINKLTKGAYTFDLGTEDKSVVVKFLTHADYVAWKKPTKPVISWENYDYAWLAQQVAETFKKRTKGEPVVIGLFFEPSVNSDSARAVAREKLRRQVEHFVDYLKREGVVAE